MTPSRVGGTVIRFSEIRIIVSGTLFSKLLVTTSIPAAAAMQLAAPCIAILLAFCGFIWSRSDGMLRWSPSTCAVLGIGWLLFLQPPTIGWVLMTKSDSTSAVAWCLLIFFLPLVGAAFFYLFGYQHVNRPLRRKRRPIRYLYICPNCGNQYPRTRRYSQSVSCSKCDKTYNPQYKLLLRA